MTNTDQHGHRTLGEAVKTASFPQVEAEILLSHILQVDRTYILAHAEQELMADHSLQWNEWSRRLSSGEPLAYIIGEREFYGRMFTVNHAVLIPRPATEGLVDLALVSLDTCEEQTKDIDSKIVAWVHPIRDLGEIRTIIDIGTGSGCIAITLALEHPELHIIATDISVDALKVARVNAKRHGALDRVSFALGSALFPVRNLRTPFLIVSNPPYIPEGRVLDKNVGDFEPHAALFSGNDGTTVIKEILEQAEMHPHCAGVILECEAAQAKKLASE